MAGHIEMLYQVLDEIREDFQWAVRNDKFRHEGADEWRPVTHITSMPKDPCAPDFGARINRFSAADLPSEDGAETVNSNRQGTLFE